MVSTPIEGILWGLAGLDFAKLSKPKNLPCPHWIMQRLMNKAFQRNLRTVRPETKKPTW
jgi:hypothetical protein